MSHFLGVGKVFLGKSRKIRISSEICIFSLNQTFNANLSLLLRKTGLFISLSFMSTIFYGEYFQIWITVNKAS